MKTEIFETFWKFWNIEKKIKFWIFWKFLKLKKKLNFWNIEIFWKFGTYFIIDFRILKFYEIFEILWNFWKSCFPFRVAYRETIGLLNGKQLVVSVWVNFHKTLKLFQVMWFNLSQWEVSEV